MGSLCLPDGLLPTFFMELRQDDAATDTVSDET